MFQQVYGSLTRHGHDMQMVLPAEKSDERRRKHRSRVLLAAFVDTDGVELPVRLRDLSCYGALLDAEIPPRIGGEVVFRRGKTRVPAIVRWARRGRFGIRFIHPIEETEVLIHVSVPPKKADDINQFYRRPGLRSTTLTPEERAAAELWVKPARKFSLGE